MSWKPAPIAFKLRGYKVAEDISITVEKTVLYGPNSSGKTATMEVLYAALTGRVERLEPIAVRENFEAVITVNDRKYGVARKGREFVVYENGRILEITDDVAKAFDILHRKLAGEPLVPKTTAWIDSCSAELPATSIEICRFERPGRPAMSFERLKPDELVKLEDFGGGILSSSYLYYSQDSWWVKKDDAWIPVHNLAYGYRRVLAVLAALITADAVFIEAFEAGFHADLALELLRLINKWFKDKVVVIETHHGVAVTTAVKMGWRGYYLENGKVVKELVKTADLSEADLYKRELEIYSMRSALEEGI